MQFGLEEKKRSANDTLQESTGQINLGVNFLLTYCIF